MMRALVAIPLLVVLIAAAVLLFGGPAREFTTTSSEAYDLYTRGYEQANAFQFAKAESSLAQAVALDPDFAMAHTMLAYLYARHYRRDEADAQIALADSLAASLVNDVERAKVQLTLAIIQPGHRAERDSLLAYLMTEEPENLLVLSAHAGSLDDGDPGASEAVWLKILEIEPNYAPAYNMLGYLAAHDGRYDEAEMHLRKYTFMAPDLANPHDSLGEILARVGKYDEAEREFVTALKMQDDFHYSLINLGAIYLDQGMIAKGEDILGKVRKSYENPGTRQRIDQMLIHAFYTWGLHQRSTAGITAFLDEFPEAFTAGYYRAILAAIENRFDDGDRELATFLEFARGEAARHENEALARRIDSYHHQYDALVASIRGDHVTAAGCWNAYNDATLEDTPPHERWWTHWRLGKCQLEAGNGPAALESARNALSPNPNRILPLMLAARAALASDQRAMSRTMITRLEPLLAKADPELPVQAAFRELKSSSDSHASSQ